MWFDDLSPYQYLQDKAHSCMYNVGWLAKDHGFPKGKTSSEFLTCLFAHCRAPVNKMRGFHHCEFCDQQHGTSQVLAEKDGERIYLGNAEIHVRGDDSKIYVAPTLIYHYVSVHEYLPPAAFIEAVCKCDWNWREKSETQKGLWKRLLGK